MIRIDGTREVKRNLAIKETGLQSKTRSNKAGDKEHKKLEELGKTQKKNQNKTQILTHIQQTGTLKNFPDEHMKCKAFCM